MLDHPRLLREGDLDQPTPVYTVWELTLRCDQVCLHCGSRAGRAAPDELDTDQVEAVARQLRELGCREVTLIGGEVYLRDDLAEVVERLTATGLYVNLLTGGRRVSAEDVAWLEAAGIRAISVSLDGPPEIHDALRRVPGGHAKAMGVLAAARELGLPISVNTQINRRNMRHLHELVDAIYLAGVRSWQVQLTVPMGRAADDPDLVIQPWDVLEILPTLAGIQERTIVRAAYTGEEPFDVFAGDDIGYFGPYEIILRSRPRGPASQWMGCYAGRLTAGVHADGEIKPCLSLPRQAYAAGSALQQPLAEIWQSAPRMLEHRARTREELWGFCGTCPYGEQCLAGCPFTQHATLGRRGNNPFCWYRADQLRQRGLRECLVRVEDAPGGGFDFAHNELVEEPWPQD